MKYKCTVYNEQTQKQDCWEINLYILSICGSFTEFMVNGRGSSMHAIAGPQINGNFLCLPSYGIGSELADYSDEFWNREQLSRVIGKIDAASLATALKQLDTLI